MSGFSRNFLANLIGKGSSALIGLALTPVYIHYLGMEAVGLVGFYVTLQATTQILDLGLSTTINREMALCSADPQRGRRQGDLLRTLELMNWAVAVAIGVAVWLLAPVLAHHWIKPDKLSTQSVVQAIELMGAALALRWPTNIYNGALMGMHRQVAANVLLMVGAVITGVGVVAILAYASATVCAFFAWQLCANAMITVITGWWCWRSLRPQFAGPAGRFDSGILRATWHFAVGMSGISILGMLLTQLDKIVLSKMFDLEHFGYYTVASLAAGGLSILILTVFNAVFPVLSRLVAAKDQSGVVAEYHRAARTMAGLIMPPALLIAFFAGPLILLWTRKPEVANAAGPVLSMLIIGSCLNGLMNVPYALQLAHGYLRLGLVFNICALVLLAPLVYAGALLYGGVGAAAGWVLLNGSYVLAAVPLTHRRLLPGQNWRWYIEDTLPPLVVSLLVVAGCWWCWRWLQLPILLVVPLALGVCYACLWRWLTRPRAGGG